MKPILSIVQDDADVRRLLERDLRERFGAQYEIEAHADGVCALRAIEACADDGRAVKRVASAVGAGSIAVQLAHIRLAELG